MYFHYTEPNFPNSPPYPPPRGVKPPHPDIPKFQYWGIIWENSCCDFIFQPIFKNNSFLERAKFALAFKNIIMYSYYGKISIFAKKVLKCLLEILLLREK